MIYVVAAGTGHGLNALGSDGFAASFMHLRLRRDHKEVHTEVGKRGGADYRTVKIEA